MVTIVTRQRQDGWHRERDQEIRIAAERSRTDIHLRPERDHALVERHFTFAAGVARNAHRYKIREQVAGDAAVGRSSRGTRRVTRPPCPTASTRLSPRNAVPLPRRPHIRSPPRGLRPSTRRREQRGFVEPDLMRELGRLGLIAPEVPGGPWRTGPRLRNDRRHHRGDRSRRLQRRLSPSGRIARQPDHRRQRAAVYRCRMGAEDLQRRADRRARSVRARRRIRCRDARHAGAPRARRLRPERAEVDVVLHAGVRRRYLRPHRP